MDISRELMKLAKDGRELRAIAMEVPYDESVKIREKQNKLWGKYNFLKGYQEASKKLKKEEGDKNGNQDD